MPFIPEDKALARAAKRKTRKGRPVKPSKREEGRLRRAMQGLWEDVLLPATERLKLMVKQGASPAQLASFIEETLIAANMAYGRVARGIVDRWTLSVDRELQNAIHRTMQDALGIDVLPMLQQPPVADTLAVAGTQAANLIVTIPQQYLAQVAQAVADNFHGQPLPEGRSLLQQIQHIGGVSRRRAKLIARDQTSKLTAALNQHRQQACGIDTYLWRCVLDERVVGKPGGLYPAGNSKHGDHWDMEGKLCRWDDPTVWSPDGGKTWRKRDPKWSTRHPGEDIQCRCWAEPIIDPEKIIGMIK